MQDGIDEKSKFYNNFIKFALIGISPLPHPQIKRYKNGRTTGVRMAAAPIATLETAP